LPDRLDEATNYIRKMQERIEQLKEKKSQLIAAGSSGGTTTKTNERRSPQIEVRDLGSGVNAVLIISSDDDQAVIRKSICAVEGGGAEVLNANYTSVGDKSILSLHTLVSRIEH
jgi:secreted trypsin-like serine protease